MSQLDIISKLSRFYWFLVILKVIFSILCRISNICSRFTCGNL